jgi:acetyl esterase/lipase
MDDRGIRRKAITEDSAGGNLAVLASCVAGKQVSSTAILVGAALLSPVTDLTLSGATYETRAEADPYFTKQQVAALVGSYLGSADANDPPASMPALTCRPASANNHFRARKSITHPT